MHEIKETETSVNHLSNRDIKKLREIQKHMVEGIACTYEKEKCLMYLDSILNPKCSVCRKPLTDPIYIINDHKMHVGCRKRYKG
ncbi:MAG: hypothetical protein U9Q22_00550 [Candidatus Altiarchaeota archaeon]|nr:hypothetical protein [Candidatus Altiarchaeota archaeon]